MKTTGWPQKLGFSPFWSCRGLLVGQGHLMVSFESEQDSKEGPSDSFMIEIIHFKNLFLFSVNECCCSEQPVYS